MTSKTISKSEKPTILIFSIFYIAVGIAEVGYFAIENFAAPMHIPVLGILSLITAYSLFKMKRWSVPLVIGLFVTGITFGVTTLSNSIALQTFGGAMLFHIALIAYIVILLIVSIYTVAIRENFN
jgi:hypothetical protein